jgi:glycosyltransferase involved in cell wall biosynthesis
MPDRRSNGCGDAVRATESGAVPNEPSLSVILPNYNHAHYIARAIEALAEQEPAPSEILVIDDASSDNSRDVIEAVAARIPSVSLIANAENKGVAFRSQQGLEAARGQYVYFAASDDLVLPGFFRLALDCLERIPQAGLCCGEAILINGETGNAMGARPAVRPRLTCGYLSPEQTRRLLARSDNWILTGSAILRRAALVEAGRFDPLLGSFADGCLVRKIALRHGFCFAPEPVSIWRIFPKGVSRSVALADEKAKEFLVQIPRYIESDPAFPDWYADKFRDRWRFAAARLALEPDPIRRDVLLSMGAQRPLDDRLIKLIMNLPLPVRLLKLCILFWLVVRLRPTDLGRFALTSAVRALEKRSWTPVSLSAYISRGERRGTG